MKAVLFGLLRMWFRFRAFNTEALNTPGPVLLLPNHVSWLDWLFLGVLLDEDWRFVTSSTTAEASWFHRKIMVNRRTFPVDTQSPYAARRMAEFLEKGGRLVLFPEGRITVTGALMKLFDGTGFLLHKTGAQVILCHLRNANRVRFVRHSGWTLLRPSVSAHFSPALRAPRLTGVSNTIARQKMTNWLRDQMVRQQFEVEMAHGKTHVLAAVAETASNLPGKIALEDVSGAQISYRRLMMGADLLGAALREFVSDVPAGGRVGLLLPNVNGMAVSLLALWAIDRVPAILNFSSGIPAMLACARLAGLRRVVTSRLFLEKAKLDLAPFQKEGIELICLEDVRVKIGGPQKLAALVRHRFRCGAQFRALSGDGTGPAQSQTAVVLFTSGSEGMPKGVELTHRNLLANIRQIDAMLDVTDEERFFNALPLFHSFGLTACTLFPLVRGLYAFLYPSPLHYRVVPAAVYDRNCTVMVGTNTFLNGYARKAHPYDFQSVKYLVAGAEKVQEATADTWARKFGIRLLEGYGATECSPVVCVNNRLDAQFGTVGRFMPGMDWKLEHVAGVSEPVADGTPGESTSANPVFRAGRLFVKGPNVMKGYLNPEANAAFLSHGGWYDTGDLARVDEDGFVRLLGRMKRFAKISGEMVSLTAVEDALAGAFPQYGLRCEIAVVAVPDPDKGERLVAVTNESRLSLEDLRGVIKEKGLSNLAAPREIVRVPDIPKLGTGKVNHRELLAQVQARKSEPVGVA